MDNTFLPKDYTMPSTGGADFMKFADGDNRFRILSTAVIGTEFWKNGKPFRKEETVCSITPDMADHDEKYGKPKIATFWGFAVWNYAEKKVQILTLTQKTIMGGIHSLVVDSDWGDPRKYDLNVNKVKQGDKTTYTVKSYPHKELPAEIKQAYEDSEIDPRSIITPVANLPMPEVAYPSGPSETAFG